MLTYLLSGINVVLLLPWECWPPIQEGKGSRSRKPGSEGCGYDGDSSLGVDISGTTQLSSQI